MKETHSVLIVDRSEETREVLQTALGRHGVRTLAAGGAKAGVELARRHQPELIVLDLELDDVPDFTPSADSAVVGASAESSYRPYLVLLGSLRGWRGPLPRGEFVSKPYHFGPLIRKIETLLASGAAARSPDRADAVCDSRDRPGQPV